MWNSRPGHYPKGPLSWGRLGCQNRPLNQGCRKGWGGGGGQSAALLPSLLELCLCFVFRLFVFFLFDVSKLLFMPFSLWVPATWMLGDFRRYWEVSLHAPPCCPLTWNLGALVEGILGPLLAKSPSSKRLT